MYTYDRSLPLSAVILSIAIGASAQNAESDFGDTFFSAVDASNLPASSTVLSTVNSTLDNLDQLNDLKDGLESLRRNAAKLEQLRNAFSNEYVSLYSIGNGRAPIGQIDDAYRGLQTTISNLDDAVGRLSDFQTSTRGFTTSVARGIGTTTRYVGTIGDLLAIVSAANTFADEEATLVEEINAVSSLAGVVVTTYAPATGAVLAPVQLTLLASDKYVDATRNVATDILGQMENDKAEYLNAARQIILKATVDNPELSPQEILAFASLDLNRLGQDYFEIYEYQNSLHRAVYGEGISRLASGLGNAASGGAVERRYLENLDFFSGIVSDQNSDLFETLLTISTATSERVESLNEIQGRIAQTLRQIEATSGAVSSNLQQSFEAVQSIGQELEDLSAPVSFEAESDVALLSPSGVIESTSDAGLIITENDEGDPVLGNNAGTNIEIPTEPTGLTPEEIAEEEERLAEEARLAALRLQQIADLEAARDSLSITQQDAQARLQERRNRLTVLQFNELEQVTEASGLVSGRIQELRTEQNATGLSASDQQLLLDLVAYEDRLQTEQDRIARDITAAQNAISQYEASLAQVETQLDTNAASLEGADYSIASDYTVPNFTPEGLTDWTNYDYELPAFDPTEVELETTRQVGFISALNATTGSTFSLTHGAIADVAGDGSEYTVLSSVNGPLEIVADIDETSGYNHLSWGTYSGTVTYTDTHTGISHDLENVRWIHGDGTPASYFENLTGTASWSGNVYGDYALTGTESTFYDAVTGDVGFIVDFSDGSVTGELTTSIHYQLDDSTSVGRSSFRDLTGDFYTSETNEMSVAGIHTSIETFGGDQDGELFGTFYGPNAEEFGGAFWFSDEDGMASGVVVAEESDWGPGRGSTVDIPDTVAIPEVSVVTGVGVVPGGSGSTSTGDVSGGFVTPTSTDTPQPADYSGWIGAASYISDHRHYDTGSEVKSGFLGTSLATNSTAENIKFSVEGTGSVINASSETTDDEINLVANTNYDYVAWGTWGQDHPYSLNSDGTEITNGSWFIADQTTDLRTTGSASYNGQADGYMTNGVGTTSIQGNIQINADFAADTVNGTMNLNSGQQSWAQTSFDTTIRRDSGKGGFQGALTGSDVNSGVIFGAFSGPNAEEIGGGWQIDHTDGSNATGIFRAQN